MSGERFTYAASGVDIDAGERAVALMRSAVERTNRPEVVGGLGGFAGLFALDTARYRRPLLASSTDGVGTKIALARQLDRHDTVGIDLVAMVVDDLVACGAEPLFLQDYVACGKVVPERIAAIVTGIATGCTLAGAALVGGETAEHGDLMGADDYDLAATAVGVVEADAVLGPERVRNGDVVVAMASSGLHSNGYSLVRRVVATAGLDLTATPAGLDRPLGEELLEPTRIYARDCLALVDEFGVDGVHAYAHITGGGLAGNTSRVV
ncbi:MAG: phosphoribosylformylglycinamidine cyclo-ligase, partial [Actinomycetes bacterium]